MKNKKNNTASGTRILPVLLMGHKQQSSAYNDQAADEDM